MKSRIIFLLAAMMICGLTQAQENYYQMPNYGYENNMTFRAKVCIDGVEQQSVDIIEIGAFNGNTVTDSKFVKCFGSNHYYRVNMTIGGGSTPYPLTFKLYDHEHEVELVNYTITDPDGNPCEGITWQIDANLGTYKNPYVLNFITSSTSSYTKQIAGYSGENDRYYLIASPVGEVDPENVENMLNNNYDLYSFDQTQDLEWINYEAGHYNLVSGMGYLYANSEDVTLTFNGTPIEDNTYEVSLVMDEDIPLSGWNLVGNPFACDATVSVSNYYRMNDAGTEIEPNGANETVINVMEGIFVKATEDGQSVTFSKVISNSGPEPRSGDLNVNVIREGNRVDLARVRFGQGNGLEKFQLDPNHTKVYFPIDDKDMAVVYPEGQVGELPLNFKAESNGSYTLSFTNEDRTFNYLHLIDNMTGNDINLLQTPSYSFEAKTTDYASRFRLVFATEDAGGTPADQFAYIDANGNIIITCDMGDGEGDACNASLQVVDVIGRVLICRDALNASRNASVSTSGMTPGVYVLRLIIGDSVRTQKIVVK